MVPLVLPQQPEASQALLEPPLQVLQEEPQMSARREVLEQQPQGPALCVPCVLQPGRREASNHRPQTLQSVLPCQRPSLGPLDQPHRRRHH